ncbi:RDD family protein [Nocardioides jejuensis]|uniref:RDD family protein n=1 Tax=Nocardioides jejuensis TaxID=2502782 RepID=A0A4R1BXF7_9ACTN|nr:RDD family protein [Nocardioides jejuensis]TCJ22106.1 RDD family protein [Nocardioides jejuensis]
MSDAAAGWYPDPTPAPGVPTLRYWDGAAWTEHVAPAQQYVSPAYAAQPVGPTTPDGVPLAHWGWRVLAYLIDSAILMAATMPLMIPMQIHMQRRMDDLVRQVDANSSMADFWSVYGSIMREMMYAEIPAVLIVALYAAVMMRWKGATIGKLALGLQVRLRDRTDRLPWSAIVVRVLTFNGASLLPMVLLAVGLWRAGVLLMVLVACYGFVDGLWPLWGRDRQALHDKFARTYVVKTR